MLLLLMFGTWYLFLEKKKSTKQMRLWYFLHMLLFCYRKSGSNNYTKMIFASRGDKRSPNNRLLGNVVQKHRIDTVYPKKYAHGFCFAVVCCGYTLIFPYPSGLLHWHCGNLTIAPVPAKQPWWIWINTSCEFIMNDCITTTKQSTTKPCAYFLGYTVRAEEPRPLLSSKFVISIEFVRLR